jgi:hypothetical protein
VNWVPTVGVGAVGRQPSGSGDRAFAAARSRDVQHRFYALHRLSVSRHALRYIAAIGPAAARFTQLLHKAATQDERLGYSGGWRGITEDEEAQSLAGQALAAVPP